MHAFEILRQLTWNLLLSFILQMLVITAIARGLLAVQARFLWGSWRQRMDFVIVAHAMALLLFAAMTNFVVVGAPPQTFFGSLLHSLTIVWPLQLALLAIDLAICAAFRRRAG